MLSFFVLIVIVPGCVMRARCPVAACVNVPVLPCMFALGVAVCVGLAPESNINDCVPSVVSCCSAMTSSRNWSRSFRPCSVSSFRLSVFQDRCGLVGAF